MDQILGSRSIREHMFLNFTNHQNSGKHFLELKRVQGLTTIPDRTVRYTRPLRLQVEQVALVLGTLRTAKIIFLVSKFEHKIQIHLPMRQVKLVEFDRATQWIVGHLLLLKTFPVIITGP